MRDYQELALSAEQLNIRGDYRAVVELLEPYVGNINNKNTSFFNELGIAYGKIGSQLQDVAFWYKAYDCHKKAYDLDSNEPIYMFNLAIAATWIEHYEEAQELTAKYLESGHRKERKLAKDLLKKEGQIKEKVEELSNALAGEEEGERIPFIAKEILNQLQNEVIKQ